MQKLLNLTNIPGIQSVWRGRAGPTLITNHIFIRLGLYTYVCMV